MSEINADVLNPIADNIADWGTDTVTASQAVLDFLDGDEANTLNTIKTLVGNCKINGERLIAEAGIMREEIANPTG